MTTARIIKQAEKVNSLQDRVDTLDSMYTSTEKQIAAAQKHFDNADAKMYEMIAEITEEEYDNSELGGMLCMDYAEAVA